MLAYYCTACAMYVRESELLKDKRCPECKQATKPRMLLAGKVMGREEEK